MSLTFDDDINKALSSALASTRPLLEMLEPLPLPTLGVDKWTDEQDLRVLMGSTARSHLEAIARIIQTRRRADQIQDAIEGRR